MGSLKTFPVWLDVIICKVLANSACGMLVLAAILQFAPEVDAQRIGGAVHVSEPG